MALGSALGALRRSGNAFLFTSFLKEICILCPVAGLEVEGMEAVTLSFRMLLRYIESPGPGIRSKSIPMIARM